MRVLNFREYINEAFEASDLKKSEVPDSEFDAEQLRMGIEVEKEHSDDPEIAKAIVKAHLEEIPDYYDRLLDMEKKAGAYQHKDI